MRNYKKVRQNYHSKPEQMLRNAARKRARRQMEKEGKAEKFDGKDVHHKDNNPLNNDKNNLSLVTQHYNRKEPRLREKKLKLKKEDAASRAQEIADLRAKHRDEIAKEREARDKEREAAEKEREAERQDTKESSFAQAAAIAISKQKSGDYHKSGKKKGLRKTKHKNPDHPKAKTNKQRKKEKQWKDEVEESKDIKQAKVKKQLQKIKGITNKQIEIILTLPPAVLTQMITQVSQLVSGDVKDFMKSVEEDMGTVTGPHIAGTGDDSSTVIVRKKKNAQVQKRQKQLLKDRIKELARQRNR